MTVTCGDFPRMVGKQRTYDRSRRMLVVETGDGRPLSYNAEVAQ
jgi:hypothetical protein